MNAPRVLLNDFKKQWAETSQAVLEAVQAVGASGWYILGASVASFEKSLSAALGTRFAIGCGNGLDAIEIALRALELPPGGKVLTTPLSAFATTLAIVRAGGVPVFVDVDANGNLDLGACETLLDGRTDIRHVVPVHLYGSPLDLPRLARWKQRFGVRIIEDCAQAIQASYGGQLVSSVGEAAAFSFYPTKNLGALGDAGAVTVNDEALAERCRSLRNYGQTVRYEHHYLGLNSRLDELHAAILDRALLPRLADWSQRRRHVAALYRERIRHPHVRCLEVSPESRPVWHLFPVFVPPVARQSFQEHLQLAGVQSGVHYPSLLSDQPALRQIAFEAVGSLPQARAIASSEVSLPIHPYLDDDDINLVIDAVNSWHWP